eukprot:851947-Rhodomonas_salina.2
MGRHNADLDRDEQGNEDIETLVRKFRHQKELSKKLLQQNLSRLDAPCFLSPIPAVFFQDLRHRGPDSATRADESLGRRSDRQAQEVCAATPGPRDGAEPNGTVARSQS